MSFFGKRVSYWALIYITCALYLAWKLARQAYHSSLEEATLLSEATGVFSNIIFVAILLMGFSLFMMQRVRKRIGL